MSYSMVLPPELIGELYRIRKATGIPIRRQIINATATWIEMMKREIDTVRILDFRECPGCKSKESCRIYHKEKDTGIWECPRCYRRFV